MTKKLVLILLIGIILSVGISQIPIFGQMMIGGFIAMFSLFTHKVILMMGAGIITYWITVTSLAYFLFFPSQIKKK